MSFGIILIYYLLVHSKEVFILFLLVFLTERLT